MLYHPKVLVIIMPMKYQDLVVLKLKVPQMTMNQNIYPIMMIILHVLDPNMTVPQICHCPSLNQEKDLRGAEVRRVLVSLLVLIRMRDGIFHFIATCYVCPVWLVAVERINQLNQNPFRCL